MAIGTNITRISFIRLLEKTGEIDKLIDELSKINNINDIVKFTTLNYRFVWLLELLHKDKVKFKKYIQQFNRLPKELKDFQDTIYNLSDEFMKSQVFKLFENNYKNSIWKETQNEITSYGALGFIGKHLVEVLKQEGYDVTGIDIAVVDYDGYLKADITYFEDVWRIFKENKGFDMVIHLAGEVGRINGEEYPQKMLYVNEIGTLNLINLSLEYDSKLVYFSSSEVYGTLLTKKK